MAQQNIKKTTEQFKEEAKLVHGDKWDYNKSIYKGNKIPLIITCPIHGDFMQTPVHHLKGRGCPECGKHKCMKGKPQKITQEDFINRCIEKYKDKYIFTNTVYSKMHDNIEVTCPIHGVFKRQAYAFLHGCECPECTRNKIVKSTESFITEASQIHNNFFDYTDTIYTNSQGYIKYRCPIHGIINQRASNHLKYGCPKCAYDKMRLSKEEYVEKAINVHGHDFDYTNSIYIGMEKPINITCNKKDRFGNTHGEFITIARDHIYKKYGCPKCTESILEQEVRHLLINNKIEYTQHYRTQWLERKTIDFFLPQYSIGIECQGIQHFKSIDYFGGDKMFIEQIERDNLKRKLCEEHGIKLLYYSNLGIEYPYQVYENLDELLKEIKGEG